MKKLVDGQLLDMSAEEEAAFIVDQAATPPARRRISKELLRQRVENAGKIDQAMELIMGNPSVFSRWTLPGRTDVYVDDPDTLAIIGALGLNADQILAE